jgi:hypothetical protein
MIDCAAALSLVLYLPDSTSGLCHLLAHTSESVLKIDRLLFAELLHMCTHNMTTAPNERLPDEAPQRLYICADATIEPTYLQFALTHLATVTRS